MSDMSEPAKNALFSYPPQAAFGRALPKNKLYEKAGANTRLKDLFVAQVDQIVWQYKLAPETINLPANPGVPEVQVFSIHLKAPKLHPDVLRCIDGAVQFPIIFELYFEGRVQGIACHKRPSEADASQWVCSDYFATDWLPSDYPRAPTPLALNLTVLYELLLQRIIPLPIRKDESIRELVARVELATQIHKEMDRVTTAMSREKQFNKKVEINSFLRDLKIKYERLCQ